MAINKKLIHFNYYDKAPESDTSTGFISSTNGTGGATTANEQGNYGNIPSRSIVFIKDKKKIWTHGQLYDGADEVAIGSSPDTADSETQLYVDTSVDLSTEFYTKAQIDALLAGYTQVQKYSARNQFPITGNLGVLYVNTSDNKTYKWNGSDYEEINSSGVQGTVAITNGGTGATTAADARTNLGITPANIGAAPADSAIYTITAAAGTNINVVGTPSVTASTSNNATTLTFNNLKGERGTQIWVSSTAPDNQSKINKV